LAVPGWQYYFISGLGWLYQVGRTRLVILG